MIEPNQYDEMAEKVRLYSDILINLVDKTEQAYAYAKPDGQTNEAHAAEINQHISALTVIIGAALSEVAKLQQISPVVLETLSALMPHQDKNQTYTLSQPTLLKELAEKIGTFQKLLDKVDAPPAEFSKVDISIQQEMKECLGMIKTLEASPEFKNVENLANLKLLSQILEHGVALKAEAGPEAPPPGPRGPRPR